MIRWPLAAMLLLAGGYWLFWAWAAFNRFGVTRSLAYELPPGRQAEIMFWYALPGFQLGLLLGLLLALAPRRVGRLLVVLNLAVWAELAVNVLIIGYLFLVGALF